jgi:hypothetical protein
MMCIKLYELNIIDGTKIITNAFKCISQKCLIAYEQVHMQSRLMKIWWYCKYINCDKCMIIYVKYQCIKNECRMTIWYKIISNMNLIRCGWHYDYQLLRCK